jgi:hypothetical protein
VCFGVGNTLLNQPTAAIRPMMNPTRVSTSVVTNPVAMRVIPKAHINGQVVGVGNSTPFSEECSCSWGFIESRVRADDVNNCNDHSPDTIHKVPIPGDHPDMFVVAILDAARDTHEQDQAKKNRPDQHVAGMQADQ